jgi:hypothetical protein
MLMGHRCTSATPTRPHPPSIAPILLGLNNSAISLGTATAGIIGAAGIQIVGGRYLGYIGAIFVAASMIVSELSARRIAAVHQTNALDEGSMHLGPQNKGSYVLTKSLCFAVIALIGLSATGCSVGPHYQQPAVKLQPYVNAPAITSQSNLSPPPLEAFWTGFADPEVTRIVKQALAQNLGLAASVARIEQARAVAKEAGAKRTPYIDLEANDLSLRQSLESPVGRYGSSFLVTIAIKAISILVSEQRGRRISSEVSSVEPKR